MRRLLLAALLVLALPRDAFALADSRNLDGHFGLGFQIGAPFAITGKYWLSREQALQAYIGTFGRGWNAIGADWVYEFAHVSPGAPVHFGFHVGVGGILAFGNDGCFDTWGRDRCRFDDNDDDLGVGVRMPIAANMYFNKVPIEVYLELAPVFIVVPGFAGDLLAGLGGRFYF